MTGNDVKILLPQYLKSHRWFVVVWLTFLALAITYSVITPPFEMSDETRHYAVVKYMADTGRLPVQQPGAAQRHWSHEGNQPPLYYGLAALLTGWIDTGTWDDVYWYNPHTSAGIPLRPDNKNMTVHTDREVFPWRGYTLAVHLARFLSIATALVTIFFTYSIALRLFNGQRTQATIATAVAAFTPMFIFISSAVNNDNMVIMFSTIATWLLVKMAQEGSSGQRVLWLGMVVGLGALSKLYALGLLPLAGALFFWQGVQTKDWRTFWRHSLLFGGAVLAVAGWWYVRNFMLYGDFLALKPMHAVAGRRDSFPSLSEWLYEFQGFRIAYWGLFGGVNVIAPDWVYRLLDGVSLLAGVGFAALGALWMQRRTFPLPRRINAAALWIVVGWAGIMFAGFMYWNSTIGASQGRLMFPAIASLSALMVIGLSWWLPQKYALLLPLLLAGGLLIFAIVSPWLFIAPAYAKPPLLTIADVPPDITPLDYTFNGKMRLLGVQIPDAPLHAAETLPVTAYWEVLQPMTVNYSVYVQLVVPGTETVGQLDTYPGLGAWPTTLLNPGDVLADTYSLEIDPRAEKLSPAVAQVALGLYEYDKPGYPRLPAVDGEGNALEDTIVGQVKLIPWQWPDAAPAHPLTVQFAGGIALAGYDSNCEMGESGCTLTLYWRATGTPSADYQVFVQLWDETQQLAGFDAPPRGGRYPTRWWSAGETVVDRHPLVLPLNLPPGDYRLRLGLYRLDTGARLPTFQGDEPLPDFAVDIPVPAERLQ